MKYVCQSDNPTGNLDIQHGWPKKELTSNPVVGDNPVRSCNQVRVGANLEIVKLHNRKSVLVRTPSESGGLMF